MYLGSGKAAIAMALAYLRKTGVLENKMARVFVPGWLGVNVYQTMTKHCFPSPEPSSRDKVLFVYHQYGFPQDMDKLMNYAQDRKLVVIEDLAHACRSSFRGKPLGSFGLLSIYSFSKFVFCYALGGLACSEPAFASYAAEAIGRSSRGLRAVINGFKLFDEAIHSAGKGRLERLMTQLRIAAYSAYGDSFKPSSRAICLWEAKAEAEMAARQANYRFVLKRAEKTGLCDGLEREGITPYAIPLKVPDSKIARAVEALNRLGIETGPYRFDYNRCMIEPRFEPALLLPCHGGLGEGDLDRMIATVEAAL